MLHKDIIADLYPDHRNYLFYELSPYLDNNTLASASRVCKKWCLIFNEEKIWHNKIKNEYGIEIKQIEDPSLWKSIYTWLSWLKKNKCKGFKKYCVNSQQEMLLVCYRDDADHAFKVISQEKHPLLYKMALRLRCINICKVFLSKEKTINQATLNDALLAGNLKVVQYLLNPENNFKTIAPNQNTLNFAAWSGNIDLVKYILEQFKIVPNKNTLDCAADTDSLDVVRYLIENHRLVPDKETLDAAAHGRHIEIITYLLDPKNNFKKIKPEAPYANQAKSLLDGLTKKTNSLSIK